MQSKDKILHDGERLRVPMFAMDSVQRAIAARAFADGDLIVVDADQLAAALGASAPMPAEDGKRMATFYARQTHERKEREDAKAREDAERLRADKVKIAAEAGWPI